MLNTEVQNKKINVKYPHSELKSLSDQKLLSQTKLLAQKERNITIQVIQHLSEIEYRKLHLKRGFSSLFDYTVKELGYSEGSAYRRIKAMKLCREIPETSDKLKAGSLNLMTVSKLQVFFEKQNKKIIKTQSDLSLKHTQEHQTNFETQWSGSQSRAFSASTTECAFSQAKTNKAELQRSDSSPRRIDASYPKDQKLNLLKKVEGKSSRQTERLLYEIDPDLSVSKEKVRYLDKNQIEIKFTLNKNAYENIERLKHLLSHKNPNMSYQELFSILVKLGLDKYDPRQKLKKKEKHGRADQTKTDQTSSRYIPVRIRRWIWARDYGECSYICPETKKKYGSKHLLQIDHIHPYSLGGSSGTGNLRLLCAGHNQYRNNFDKRHSCK